MASRRPFLALLLASCSYVIVLDTFAAAVAFPKIEEAFPSTPRTTLAWLSSGYSIALAALLLVSGKLGDRYGRRKVYLRGMAVFTLGAVLSAAAPNAGLLIAARVVQGGGGAMMVSTSIALALVGVPTRAAGRGHGLERPHRLAGLPARPGAGRQRHRVRRLVALGLPRLHPVLRPGADPRAPLPAGDRGSRRPAPSPSTWPVW